MSEKKHTLTLPSDIVIHVTRTFDAPRELIWKMYTEKDLLKKWWGGGKYTTKVDELDLRVGGRWKLTHVDDKGQGSSFYGEYKIIDEPNKLEYTFTWEGTPDKFLIETIILEEKDGKTFMTDISTFANKEDRDEMLSFGMEDGMQDAFDVLDALIAESN